MTMTDPAMVSSRGPQSCVIDAGLFPSAVQIFIVFPVSTPFGVGGVGLGKLTPLFVVIFNTIGWSLPAYAWFRLAGAPYCLFSTVLCGRHSAPHIFACQGIRDGAMLCKKHP
jgi:hypothetical protein